MRTTPNNCLYCKKEFQALNVELRRGKAKFCGKSCVDAWKKENFSPSKEHRASITAKLKGKQWKPQNACVDCSVQMTHWNRAIVRCQGCYFKLKAENAQGRNPERVRLYSANRRALKRVAGFPMVLEEWESIKSEYYETCPACLKKEPEISLTVDHIVPLSQGGMHHPDNIQPLCLRCNLVKGTKTIYYDNSLLV